MNPHKVNTESDEKEMPNDMAKAVKRIWKKQARNLRGNEFNPDCGFFQYHGNLMGLDIEFLNKLGYRISVVFPKGNKLQVHISKKYQVGQVGYAYEKNEELA